MKILKITLVIFLSLNLCGCGNGINDFFLTDDNYFHTIGIDNFSTNEGHYELNVYIFPSEDFLEQFEYSKIAYHYTEEYENYLSIAGTERSLIVATYEPLVYAQAKKYCLDEMILSESNQIVYNGYVFIENIELAIGQGRYDKECVNSFPHWFNSLIYNDELKVLIFMGFYCPDYSYSSEDAEHVKAHWGDYLNTYFSDLYNFDTWDGGRFT